VAGPTQKSGRPVVDDAPRPPGPGVAARAQPTDAARPRESPAPAAAPAAAACDGGDAHAAAVLRASGESPCDATLEPRDESTPAPGPAPAAAPLLGAVAGRAAPRAAVGTAVLAVGADDPHPMMAT